MSHAIANLPMYDDIHQHRWVMRTCRVAGHDIAIVIDYNGQYPQYKLEEDDYICCSFSAVDDAAKAFDRTVNAVRSRSIRELWLDSPIHVAHIQSIVSAMTVDQVLRDDKLRWYLQPHRQVKPTCTTYLNQAYAAIAPSIKGYARMPLDAAERRQAARAIGEAARTGVPGRYLAMLLDRQAAVRLPRLVLAVAEILHAARPLYVSRYAGILRGKPEQVEDYHRYSRKWHASYGPARCAGAGAWVDGRMMYVADSRGNEIWSRLATDADIVATDPEARARQILGVISDRQLDRIGPAGEDDRMQIRTPMRVCRSRDGLLVADHPTRPRIVQVVVRDATTGLRHHLTVPERFGLPLTDGERPIDRVRAAIAWTFSLRANQYRPAVQA